MKKTNLKSLMALAIFAGFWGCDERLPQAVKDDKSSIQTEIDSLYDAAWDFSTSDPEAAKKAVDIMLAKSKKADYQKGIGNAYNLEGYINLNQGNYQVAIKSYLKSLEVREKIKDDAGVVSSQINIGLLFYLQGNRDAALEYYLKAKGGITSLIARDTLNASYKIKLSTIHNNIGIIFTELKKEKEALENYSKALELAEKTEEKTKISEVLNNLGNLYQMSNDDSRSLSFFSRALSLYKELQDKNGEASCLLNIGDIMVEKKDYDKALDCFNRSLVLAEEIGSKKIMMEGYGKLAYLNNILGRDSAYAYCRKYSDLKDTLLGEESQRQIAQMQVMYDTDKKEKEISLLNKDKELQDAKLNKRGWILASTAGVGILVLIIALLAIRGFKRKQRDNRLLELKNSEIERQKEEIDYKNRETTSSINYAKRIQQAVLPKDEEIYSLLPKSFVLFKPKDIVSGDFYWFEKNEDGSAWIAAADCTGHGVPGALMSMISSSLLDKAVSEKMISRPDEILGYVRKEIIHALNQKGESGEQQDGMDIALVSLRLEKEGAILQYAGANNSIYIIRDGQKPVLEEIEPDPMPVAISDRMHEFRNNILELKKGDCIYLFTDGYADQFGGPKGKKFRYAQFKELLVSLYDRPMKEQREILERSIEDWRGSLEQVDDILVIGIRI